MKIIRERPSQRLHHRVNAPLVVWLEEYSYETLDWGIGGFSIEITDHEYARDEIIEGHIEVPFQGFNISFPFEAHVKRLLKPSSIGVEFIDLGDREKDLLKFFVDEIVRGSITNVEDALLRIDTPVTPISTEPDPNPQDQMPMTRWPLKTIFYSLFYVVAGFAVLLYGAVLGYSHFYLIEIETAVVGAPIEPIRASVDGKISAISFQTGDLLEARQTLFHVEAAGLEEEIAMAQVEIDRTVLNVLTKQHELDAEKARLKNYKSIAGHEIDRLTAKKNALIHRVTLSHRQYQRFKTLNEKGWYSGAKLDEAEAAYIKLQSELEEIRMLLHDRRDLLTTLEDGRFYTGQKFEGRLQELTAEFNLAMDQIMLAEDNLSALIMHRNRLSLLAPSRGRVVQTLRSEGSSVKKGEIIALFEKEEQRYINAFLTQDEILHIKLNDSADVYFPALETRVPAQIVSIDRTAGFGDDLQAKYQWRGPQDRGAIVRLSFLGLDIDTIRETFQTGLPAVVIFNRKTKSPLYLLTESSEPIPTPSSSLGTDIMAYQGN